MRILFFTTAYDPDMEVQVVHQEFLQRLQERGHEVAILTSQGGTSRGAPYLDEERGGIPICRYALRSGQFDELRNLWSRRWYHYDGLLTIVRRYEEYMRREPRPDVVHVESAYPLGVVCAMARRQVHAPYVVTIRGADLFNEPGARFGYARYPRVRRLLREAFHYAGATRPTSPQTRDMVLEYGAPPATVHLVPRNIRDDCFPPDRPAFRAAARAEVVEKHKLPRGARLIIAAGRMLPIKGFDLLLQALPDALAGAPEARLLLCGGNRVDPVVGDYQAYLEKMAGQLGLSSQVLFTGDLPASVFTRYLAAADMVVVSSIREGSNKVLLEAAALGTPFVATTTSGTGEFFRDPPGGIEVPPGDVPALGAAVGELLRDDERRRTLGRQAAKVCGRFQSERVADEMVQLYAEVGGRRSEVGSRRSEVGGRRSEIGGRRRTAKGRRSEAGKSD